MPRYFIELSYKGQHYAGFQIQQNANSIQAEVEKALSIFFKHKFILTGSSRTDAGVHAIQNYFHFDSELLLLETLLEKSIYNLNAILPDDIVLKRIFLVNSNVHCRFSALQREYKYYIYQKKNPFLHFQSFYYPYTLDIQLLNTAASTILNHKDFTSFSKRNTQVKNFICSINESCWTKEDDRYCYTVKANRFLRGMVRGLVGTMLKVGIGKISPSEFREIIEAKEASKTDFSVPAHGLYLIEIIYPDHIHLL